MFALRLVVLCAGCLSVVLADTRKLDLEPPTTFAAENWEYRLSEHINPINYDITLRPYLLESDNTKRFTFDGEVWIEIEPVQTTNLVSLHSKNLEYSRSEYWEKPAAGATAQIRQITNPTQNAETDIRSFYTGLDLIAKQRYILHFKYTGLMGDDMHGFYRSSYVNDNNETKWLGSTQFQTNHARRAFPCFDEPQFKATFNVSLERHHTFNSASNTRQKSSTQTEDPDYYLDFYHTTPKMSTYLLAFIISEFAKRNDDKFGVLARPEYYTQTQYSFNVGRQILDEMGKYLKLDYYTLGNNKMDMAAIPDFSAGAMENWGLLTYRERSLLVDESATTLSSQQSIAVLVAHEQTHMWFGDLVTCKWWSYTWLNEGFAQYFQYFGTALVEKSWQLEKQFVVAQLQPVMGMDATIATNPLSDENTYTPAHLSRMFNSISYNKGASFIRMIEHTMGTENFQTSLQEYLVKYQYQSSVPEFLLNAWQKNWPEDRFNSSSVEIFMSFTTQVGYPLINVKLSDDGKTITFSQKRFLLKNDGSDDSLLYTVPISYTTSQEKNFMDTKPKLVIYTATQTTPLSSAANWVIANIQETGYYRVNYTEKNWHAIRSELVGSSNWGDIHEVNRAQIADDLLNLARAGHIHYDLTLSVLEYLASEVNYIPWTSAFNGFDFLAIRLGTDTAHFGYYIQQQTSNAYLKLGFGESDTDEALDVYLRTKVLSWRCRFGNAECIGHAKTYFKSLGSVPKNLRSVVYCVSLREGGPTEFDALYQKFKDEKVATEAMLLQNSFGCVKQQALIERVFDLILSDEIRRQDKSSVLTTLYTENNENVSPVFALVTTRFEKLADAMGGYSAVATVISNIASRFTEQSQYEDLQKFNSLNSAKFGSSATTLKAAETTVKENLDWAESKLDTFRVYLAKYNGSATISGFSLLSLLLVSLTTLLH
ncbi:membrane alanyl aminopeptidase [Drosophila grimshawi]|uniref:Aminopeptidase n=1 Tax=Drosophila grimshawi TaxID=7222 RepID=B4JHJ0_DROGR|nr:membrane alanyl aminopeptidase [Drosophila grimshawi]XP_032592900.1 membrane alanyl aminopeptidase [Drosophila grimshawi]EDV92817.1 GH18621 [Drosophila grimshawi]